MASSAGTESRFARCSDSPAPATAASASAHSSVSRLGKCRYSVARPTPAASATDCMLACSSRLSTVAAASTIAARTRCTAGELLASTSSVTARR